MININTNCLFLLKAEQEENSDAKALADLKFKQEEKILVTALQCVFLPRMNPIDSRIFFILVNEVWPDFNGSVNCGGIDEGIYPFYLCYNLLAWVIEFWNGRVISALTCQYSCPDSVISWEDIFFWNHMGWG